MKKSLVISCAALLILSVGANAADDFSWGNVVMGGGGFVSGIITSKTEKNVIYARTDVGGAYRWNETNQAWVPITDFLGSNCTGLFGIEAIALDPQLSERVYMLAGTSYFDDGKTMIFRSNNYGNTWDTINVTAKFKAHGTAMVVRQESASLLTPTIPISFFAEPAQMAFGKVPIAVPHGVMLPALPHPQM